MNKILLLASLVSLFSSQVFAEIDISDCDHSIKNFRQPNLSCIVKIYLNSTEREKMWTESHETIQYISCKISVNINKADLIKTLSEPVTRISRLPFDCNVLFNDNSRKSVQFTISPELHFENNLVTKVSLNFNYITGIGFLGPLIIKTIDTDSMNKQMVNVANNALAHIIQ